MHAGLRPDGPGDGPSPGPDIRNGSLHSDTHPETLPPMAWTLNKNGVTPRVPLTGSEQRIDIPTMLSGNYKINVTEDLNHNGLWDTGNLLKRRQPERVINFKDNYSLKGGWDLEIEVKL